MLDIQNMIDEDKLFNFMSGLQAWAQVELRRQGVKDLPSAINAAEGLVNYKSSAPQKKNGVRTRRILAREIRTPTLIQKKKRARKLSPPPMLAR